MVLNPIVLQVFNGVTPSGCCNAADIGAERRVSYFLGSLAGAGVAGGDF